MYVKAHTCRTRVQHVNTANKHMLVANLCTFMSQGSLATTQGQPAAACTHKMTGVLLHVCTQSTPRSAQQIHAV